MLAKEVVDKAVVDKAMSDRTDRTRNQAWYDLLSRQLGTTQLTHASAWIDSLKTRATRLERARCLAAVDDEPTVGRVKNLPDEIWKRLSDDDRREVVRFANGLVAEAKANISTRIEAEQVEP